VDRNETWVERQIREAQERGAFDNLRGAGKPIPGLTGRHDPDWWVKGLLEREEITPPLPPALALRREVQDLPETLRDCRDEAAVRELVEDLNRRIVEFRRRPAERPVVIVATVDVEQAVADWRRARRA
jgi:DnaJ-like protein